MNYFNIIRSLSVVDYIPLRSSESRNSGRLPPVPHAEGDPDALRDHFSRRQGRWVRVLSTEHHPSSE